MTTWLFCGSSTAQGGAASVKALHWLCAGLCWLEKRTLLCSAGTLSILAQNNFLSKSFEIIVVKAHGIEALEVTT